MADQWQYKVDEQELGPISASQLRQLASNGQLRKGDLVRKEGMSDWVQADSVKGLFSSATPPPIPSSVAPPSIPVAEPVFDTPTQPPVALSFSLKPQHLTWAYRGALLLMGIALLCPWVTVTGSSSANYGDIGRDMRGMGLGAYSGDYERMGNQRDSLTVSLDGLSTLAGKTALLLLIAAAILSFMGPAKIIPAGKQLIPHQEKVLMAGFGGLCCLLLLIVVITVDSYLNKEASFQSRYASASGEASIAWGWGIALPGALGMTILGSLVPWQNNVTAPNAEALG